VVGDKATRRQGRGRTPGRRPDRGAQREKTSAPQPGIWHVEPCWTRNPQPWHGLAIKEAQPHVVVDVRFFGDLIWLVHLERSALKKQIGLPYRIHLVDGSESVEG
jgi:hypothetical protein